MKCLVCHARWSETTSTRCPRCHFDHAAPNARDPGNILSARQALYQQTLAFTPDVRGGVSERLKPWLALVLAAVLFAFWLRACVG